MTDTKISDERLTEYEMQVLIGTTTHGCTMTPDRVFSLDMAWHRLHAIGLIDRTDGLAIATDKGQAVVDAILASRHQEPVNEPSARIKPLEWGVFGGVTPLFSTYYVRKYDDGRWGWHLTYGPEQSGRYATQAEAKAAAQQDYEQRIRSAIEAAPQHAPVVTVREAVRQYLDQQAAAHEDGHIEKGSYFSTLDNLPDFVAAALQKQESEE